MKQDDNTYMRKAIQWAKDSMIKGGGPFGAIIVSNDKVIAEGHNTVTMDNDPTAHAEVNVIRLACKTLNTFDLSNCDIYTSCEPCPMCLSAIYWAGIRHIYYGCTKEDAQNVNFDDSLIYKQIALPLNQRSIATKQILRAEAIQAFEMWDRKKDKIEY